ncbi:hypothetical protein [Leifsonia sp. EB34]|uniref:hypothetical protein n=1 Tax=Leifsonia sp. EB34 TaxID=3156303 RepID=UPI003510D4B5
MRLNRKTGVLIAAVSVLASMLVGNAANAAEPPHAADTTSGGVIVSGPGDNVVQFPDGTFVRFDEGRVKVELTADGVETALPSGTVIETPTVEGRASRAVYAPVTIWYSRADVEEMWRAKNNINNICRMIPLSYFGSIGCSAPATLAAALDQAHYQGKRIKALYYQCSTGTYCSYYTYQVVA